MSELGEIVSELLGVVVVGFHLQPKGGDYESGKKKDSEVVSPARTSFHSFVHHH